jgi:hypothetical protein
MSYQPILNPALFGSDHVVRLAADVHDPNTVEVRWYKGQKLTWQDIIDMLELGITDISTGEYIPM